MILIKPNNINDIYVTVKETNPYSGSTSGGTYNYIMNLISNENRSEIKDLPLGNDLSLNEFRYNKFKITESINEDLPNGIISLPDNTYDYKIYVVEGTGSTIDNTAVLCETGLLQVDLSAVTTTTTYDNINDEYTFE